MDTLKEVASSHSLRTQWLKNFRRSVSWRAMSILIVISLLMSLMGLGLPTPALAQHEGEETAEFLPSDTGLYLTVNLDPSGDQLTKFWKLINNWWQDPNVQAKWGELLEQIETESDINIVQDVLPWLGPEIAVGMRHLVPNGEGGPEMILFIGTMDKDASEAFFFDKFLPITAGEGEEPPTGPSGDYRGIDILYDPDRDMYLAFPEEYILRSNNQALLESSLDLILSPNPAASLAGTENFQQAQEALPERVGMFYCAVKDIFLEAYPDGVIPPIPIGPDLLLYIPVFWIPDFIAASLYLTDVGLNWSLYYPVPEGVEVPTTESDLLKSASLVPEETVLFFSEQNLNAGWEYILDKVEEGVAEGEEWAISLQEMLNMVQDPPPQGLGFNLSQNIFGWMDGECVLAVLPFTLSQDEPFAPEVLILVEVADTDAVATKLQAIFTAINIVIGGGLGTEATTIEGVDATLITLPGMPAGTFSPGYLFLDVGTTDYLVIGSTTDALSKAVKAKNGTIPSLDEAQEYQSILSLLPTTRVALGYISLSQIASMIVPLIPSEEVSELEEFIGYLPLNWALGFSSTATEDSVTMVGALYFSPLVIVSDLSISPGEVKPGESVTISVKVANTSATTRTYKLVLKLDGTEIDSKQVTLGSSASQTVSFTVIKDVEGTYSVDIGGLSDSFTVTSEAGAGGADWALIGGIVGGVIVVAAIVAVILLRRRAMA